MSLKIQSSFTEEKMNGLQGWIEGTRRYEKQQGSKKVNKDCEKKEAENSTEITGLVKRAQQGDLAAIERLIQKFKPYVYQMDKRFFIPGQEREDLYQEGFIGLYQAIRTYRFDSSLSFANFVSLSIRNSVIRAVRSATQKKQLVLSQAKSIFDKNVLCTEANNYNPEEITIFNITTEQISSIVKTKLSRRESKIFDLKIKGFSADEIAETCQTEKKTVDNALYRARQKIKTFISAGPQLGRGNINRIRPLNEKVSV